MQTFVINVPLRIKVGKKYVALSLNVYRNCHHHILNQAKIEFQKRVQNQIFALPQMNKIKIHYEFWYQDKRIHDLNNSMAVISKFFEDCLTRADIIKDDNYLYVVGSSNSFGGIDKKNPRCCITIEEIC